MLIELTREIFDFDYFAQNFLVRNMNDVGTFLKDLKEPKDFCQLDEIESRFVLD